MRQFNRLQWFDTITGQGDRHADNYMVDIDKTDLSVTLKAIDNDASYGVIRQGLHKFTIPPNSGMQRAFDRALDTISMELDQLKREMLADPGIKKKGGAIEIDLSKSRAPLLLAGLLKRCGLRSIVPPAEIDRELYDNLMRLAQDSPDGGAARRTHLASLEERLGKGSAQYKAAVRRLDESIEHARRLAAEGKVYSAEQWEDHDIQRRIAAPNLANMETKIGSYNILGPNAVQEYSDDARYVTFSNNFFRDFFVPLVQNSTRPDWFKPAG